MEDNQISEQHTLCSSLPNLVIHNFKSTIAEIYDISWPYMVALEIFNLHHGTVDLTMLSPHQYRTETHSMKGSIYQNRSLHRHNFFEFMFVLKGSVEQRIEEQHYTYHAGQCCLLNPNIKHVEEPTEDTETIFLDLSVDFFKTLVQNDICCDDNGNTSKTQNFVYKIIAKIQENSEYYQKEYIDFLPIVPPETLVSELEILLGQVITETRNRKPAYFMFIQGIIARIIGILIDPTRYMARIVNLENNKSEYIFSQIQRILETNNGRITRKELSSYLNYEEHYLNKIVHAQTGMSILQYGQVFLLREAARMLIQTDCSIADIIHRLGLSNRSYFYRIFKQQYGLTPKEYRNNIKESRKTIPDF